jgi:sulfate adenylyltransferase subunit 1 (EFTu-like GTPase family)
MHNRITFFDRIESIQYSLLINNLRKLVGSSITIELENDINVTRGDMIVKSSELPKVKKISIQQCVGWTVKS